VTQSKIPPFKHEGLPSRVIFGAGALAQAADEARALGSCALVLATPQQKDQGQALADQLGPLAVGLFAEAAMHTPVDVTERAVAFAQERRVDVLVAIGGGSTIGLGKAIALRTDLPQLAIPTTYAGSEMTPIIGQTEGGVKTTQRTLKVLPETVIYDPELTYTLPPQASATSGLNAVAHAVEALYSRDGNPLISLFAEEGTRALANALPKIAADPQDADARADALYGSWLCANCLALAGMALHHKLCHTLGGAFDLPHAETHAIVLPHALAYNAPAAPAAIAALGRALGTDDPALRLYEIAREAGAPEGLKSIGMPREGIGRAADLAVEKPYWNPRPIERAAIAALLERAWAGAPPSS
jgi:alcohol dehydrogenase class IV